MGVFKKYLTYLTTFNVNLRFHFQEKRHGCDFLLFFCCEAVEYCSELCDVVYILILVAKGLLFLFELNHKNPVVTCYSKSKHAWCKSALAPLLVRKPAFCICENRDADQLRGNREADQRLCFCTWKVH